MSVGVDFNTTFKNVMVGLDPAARQGLDQTLFQPMSGDTAMHFLEKKTRTPEEQRLLEALSEAKTTGLGSEAILASMKPSSSPTPVATNIQRIMDQKPFSKNLELVKPGSDEAKWVKGMINQAMPETKGMTYSDAVTAYQQKNNLSKDGLTGPETLRSLVADKNISAGAKLSDKTTQQIFGRAPKSDDAAAAAPAAAAPAAAAPAPATSAAAAPAPATPAAPATVPAVAATPSEARKLSDAFKRANPDFDPDQKGSAAWTYEQARQKATDPKDRAALDQKFLELARTSSEPTPRTPAAKVATAMVDECAVQVGVEKDSLAAINARTAQTRFWEQGKVGTNAFTRAMIEDAKRPEVAADMKKLGACMAGQANRAGTREAFEEGVKTFELLKGLSPAALAKLQAVGAIE